MGMQTKLANADLQMTLLGTVGWPVTQDEDSQPVQPNGALAMEWNYTVKMTYSPPELNIV